MIFVTRGALSRSRNFFSFVSHLILFSFEANRIHCFFPRSNLSNRENEFFSEKIYIHLDLGNLDKRSNPILSKNQPNIKILIILLPPPPPPPLFVATKKIKQNEPLSVPHYLSNPSTPRGRRIRGVEAR